jgi:hypothetical protein
MVESRKWRVMDRAFARTVPVRHDGRVGTGGPQQQGQDVEGRRCGTLFGTFLVDNFDLTQLTQEKGPWRLCKCGRRVLRVARAGNNRHQQSLVV